ncbi:MAG: hypothetical protein WD049_08750 [Candidatus Paceibacterota bacterium]
MPEQPQPPRQRDISRPAHPAIKWIVALIIGLFSSLVMMTLLVAQLIEEAGIVGEDLVFTNFFVYTGGYILLQNMGNSILLFTLTTVYYFIFFTLIGLIVGFVIEWLTKIIKKN